VDWVGMGDEDIGCPKRPVAGERAMLCWSGSRKLPDRRNIVRGPNPPNRQHPVIPIRADETTSLSLGRALQQKFVNGSNEAFG